MVSPVFQIAWVGHYREKHGWGQINP
jgi:hypothetical protein